MSPIRGSLSMRIADLGSNEPIFPLGRRDQSTVGFATLLMPLVEWARQQHVREHQIALAAQRTSPKLHGLSDR